MSDPRSARLSQTISPFGVGAILDIRGESLMAADISLWPVQFTSRIVSRRVEERLGVAELRSPPSTASTPSMKSPAVDYRRFPGWLFCQNCRRMHQMTMTEETGRPPRCVHCDGPLVPMRFIAVGTRHGHATDVPWPKWAHSAYDTEEQRRCLSKDLLFRSRATAADGLSSLEVHCIACKASRHLGELTVSGALSRIGFRCTGSQPWQSPRKGGCDEQIEVLQRGANNVTLNDVTTALDIPEPTLPVRDAEAEIRSHRNFEDLRSAPTGPLAGAFLQIIAQEHEVAEELVMRLATTAPDPDQAIVEARAGLLADEWLAFQQAIDHPDDIVGTKDFQISVTELLSVPELDDAAGEGPRRTCLTQLDQRVGGVILAHKLREIRVLHGFRRYDHDGDLVDVNLGPRGRDRWLPAVEAFGEGVLVTLDHTRLREWEGLEPVVERAHRLERRRQTSMVGSRQSALTPRLVLLHTLGHLVMRQLAFTCGYSAASLRERVYATDRPGAPQAGVLIYTAAGDSEGTLGGLVRQGQEPRLASTLLATLEHAAWCSSDPLCLESPGQGPDSLNLAACHSCSLVAETSCERSNLGLDRMLIIGGEDVPGYFTPVIDTMRQEAAAADQL